MRGGNISFVRCVDHFPEIFVTHCVYCTWSATAFVISVRLCELDGYAAALLWRPEFMLDDSR